MSGDHSSRVDDLEFARRIREGDEIAAEQFILKYRPRLIRIAWRRRVPDQDCQDVAQDALLSSLRQLRDGLYRGDSSLGTWLERIISGVIADYFRKVSKDPPIKLMVNGEMPPLDSFSGSLGNDLEMGMMIREILLDLPSESKIILMLKHAEGYTLREIATMLGLTIGQASGKLYTAQERFRERLEVRREGRSARHAQLHSVGTRQEEGGRQ